MANVTYDSSAQGNVINGTSLTFSHTCAASAALVVSVMTDTTAVQPSGVTYNGTAMTVSPAGSSAAGGGYFVVQYYTLTPTSGAHNVVVTCPSATDIIGLSVSATNVSSIGASHNSTGSSTAASDTVTGVLASSLVVDGLIYANGNNSITATSGTTSRQAVNMTGGNGMYGASSTSAGSGSMSYTIQSSSQYAMTAIELKSAGAGANHNQLLLTGVG